MTAVRIALFLAAGAVLWRARAALLPFVFAALIAYLLAPAVAALERWRLPAWASVIAVYLAVAVALGAVAVGAVPTLVHEGRALVGAYPLYARAARHGAGAFWRLYGTLPLPAPLRAESDRVLAGAAAALRTAARALLRALAAGVPVLAALVVAPFLAFYMLRDRKRLAAAFWRRIEPARRRRVAALMRELDGAVGGYLRGQLLVALAVGILALAVALVAGLPYPAFLAAVAAATDILPYVGPLLGAAPAVAFAAMRSPLTAAWVLAAFLAIHEVEGVVLSPYLVGSQVGLHPLAVFAALLIGGDLFGLAGVVLAVPAVAALRALVAFALSELEAWAAQVETTGGAACGRAPRRGRAVVGRAIARPRQPFNPRLGPLR